MNREVGSLMNVHNNVFDFDLFFRYGISDAWLWAKATLHALRSFLKKKPFLVTLHMLSFLFSACRRAIFVAIVAEVVDAHL
mmetsp:Transcript_47443/g.47867  ORF Transcript_47443/g.47867 Transcript_47443/m.47867 type:complete len:81 (-) Transcript_47443:119-361(-)